MNCSLLKLRIAVEQDNCNDVKQALEVIKADPQMKGWQSHWNLGVTNAMRDAINLRKKKIVQLFLEEGVDPQALVFLNDSCRYFFNFIHFATKVNELSIVILLVEKSIPVRRVDLTEYMQNAFAVAVTEGFIEIAAYLLNKGVKVNGYFDLFEGHSCLGKSALDANVSMVDLLIKFGANITTAIQLILLNFNKKYGNPNEIDGSCSAKYFQAISLLLDRAMGVDLSYLDWHGGLEKFKPFNISGLNFLGVSCNGVPITRKMLQDHALEGTEAALINQDDIAKLQDLQRQRMLLDRMELILKVEGFLFDGKGTLNVVPLPLAAKNGDIKRVWSALQAGINPNGNVGGVKDKLPAIIVAAKFGHISIVKLLATHPNIDTESLRQALQIAIKNNPGEAMPLQYLLEVDKRDEKGKAAIHYAVEEGDLNKVKILIKKKANLNMTNKKFHTPLYIAAKHSWDRGLGTASIIHIQILALLLEHRADSNTYKSPLLCAARHGCAKAFELLLSVTKGCEEEGGSLYERLLYDALESPEWKAKLVALKKAGADFNAVHGHYYETILECVFSHLTSCISLFRFPQKRTEEVLIRYEEWFERLKFILENGAIATQKTLLHTLVIA